MNIIGINGLKRSGKGETGNAIAALLPGVHQLGFADKLKVYAARSLGFLDLTDAESVALMDDAKETWEFDISRHVSDTDYGPEYEAVKHLTGRKYLQWMGTEARKVFGEDFWVDQVLPNPRDPGGGWYGYEHRQHIVESMYPGVETLAFTDLRFENEAQRILDLGGFIIEVVRPGAESDGHDSELKLPPNISRYVIFNGGTLTHLRWEVNKVLELEGLLS